MKKRARDELEEVFEEIGQLDEFRAGVRKKVLAYDIRAAMKAQKISPTEMARRMKVSRPTVYRLLEPSEPGATLDTLERASSALGLDLVIRLVAPEGPVKRRRGSTKKAA